MMKKEYKYGGATIYVGNVDPAAYNVLKHWAAAADMPLGTLCKYILTDAAQKKMDGKIKLTYPTDMSNASW